MELSGDKMVKNKLQKQNSCMECRTERIGWRKSANRKIKIGGNVTKILYKWMGMYTIK
jgi:hypothetical protein